jgi:hypothetical protein
VLTDEAASQVWKRGHSEPETSSVRNLVGSVKNLHAHTIEIQTNLELSGVAWCERT